jgi:hypothetical protein
MLPDRLALGRSRSYADTPQLGGDICLRLTSWDPSRSGVWFCAVDRKAMPIAASHNYGGPSARACPRICAESRPCAGFPPAIEFFHRALHLSQVICPTCRLSEILSGPLAKNIPLVPSGKSVVPLRASRPHEGRFAIVRKRGQGCDGRVGSAGRARLTRTAKPCGPDPPTLPDAGIKRADDYRRATVATKPGTPGRARDKP